MSLIIARRERRFETRPRSEPELKEVQAAWLAAMEAEQTVKTLSKIRIGRTVYPFTKPLLARYMVRDAILTVLSLESLGIVGSAPSFRLALRDWGHRFHVLFQELEGTISTEMNDLERRRWDMVASVVDLCEYRNMTPMAFRRVGNIVGRDPLRIRWLDADADAPIDLAAVPAPMAAFPTGTWFEAVVDFDRRRQQIREILSVVTIQPLDPNGGEHGEPRSHRGMDELPSDDWASF